MSRVLHGYFRSSTTYRVRLALNLKRLPYEFAHVHLLKDGGQQRSQEYLKINPQGLVPSYFEETDNGNSFTQSISIIELLEELHPEPPLLPSNASDRAWVRAFAQAIACDIHPINNLRVLDYMTREFKITEEQKITWIQHWIQEGFAALEIFLSRYEKKGLCCHGDTPTLADICLIPQVYNAVRYNCDLTPYTNINKIVEFCEKIPAFIDAVPKDPDLK